MAVVTPNTDKIRVLATHDDDSDRNGHTDHNDDTDHNDRTDHIITIKEWRRRYALKHDVYNHNDTTRNIIVEIMRYNKVAELRQWYDSSCNSYLGIPPPRESLNRWIFEQRQYSTDDPLIISSMTETSESLETELINSIPSRIQYNRIVNDRVAISRLHDYYTSATTFINKHSKVLSGLDDDSYDYTIVPKQEMMDTFHAVRSYLRSFNINKSVPGISKRSHHRNADHHQRYNHHHRNKRTKVTDRVISVFEELERKVSIPLQRIALPIVRSYVRQLHEKSSMLYKELRSEIDSLVIPSSLTASSSSSTFVTSSLTATHDDDKSVKITLSSSTLSSSTLTATSLTASSSINEVILRRTHYDKLRMLWLHHYRDHYRDADRDHHHHHVDNIIDAHIFIMMVRYMSLFGDISSREGTGFQGAVPKAAFDIMTDKFDVGLECFASPLNCHYAHFCSAFVDTDFVFGSIGSFFDHTFVAGSLEANPPFTIELMQDMVDHITKCLQSSMSTMTASSSMLTFIIVIPAWTDSKPNDDLRASPWMVSHNVLKAYEHKYISGEQFWVDTSVVKGKRAYESRLLYTSVHDTDLFIVSNNKDSVKKEMVDDLMRSWN